MVARTIGVTRSMRRITRRRGRAARGGSDDGVTRGTKAASGSRDLLEALALLDASTKQGVEVGVGGEPFGTRLVEVVNVLWGATRLQRITPELGELG